VASLAQSIADDRWRLLRAGAIDNSTFAIRLGGPDQFIANHEEIDAKPADAQAIAGGAQSRPPAGRGGSQSLVQLATSKGETHDIESDFPGEALPPQFDS
jgi:hypothetical protein